MNVREAEGEVRDKAAFVDRLMAQGTIRINTKGQPELVPQGDINQFKSI